MLLFFEGMMCRQRQNNVLMLRSMRRPIKPILAYRSNKWGVVSSDSIVPGDIISVQSISDEGTRNNFVILFDFHNMFVRFF